MRSKKPIFLFRCDFWKLFFSLCCVLGSGSILNAQTVDTADPTLFPIQLDTFVVRAGFDVNAFIRRVQNDTTFFKAFRSMHLVPFTSHNTFDVFDKGEQRTGTFENMAQQRIDKECRITSYTTVKDSGDFYRKDSTFRYYTAEMFYHLFFSKTPVCNENDIVAGALEAQGKGRLEKNKFELKQLMFNPGSKVKGVPFMGNKATIFEDGQWQKYDFSIHQDTYEGEAVYIFKVIPKKQFVDEVVFSELTTWFRINDYSIMARDYSLSFHTLFYDFDVKMFVRLQKARNKLLPSYIKYDGNWHVFTQKREHLKVEMKVKYN